MAKKQIRAGGRRWFPVIAAVLLLILLGTGWFLLFRVNRFYLTLETEGEGQMLVEYGEAYAEPGCRAVLRGTVLWEDGFPARIPVATIGEVDCGKLGKYILEYRASFGGLEASASRTVRVVDTVCPEIILTPDPEDMEPVEEYIEAGFRAVDNYDGDITGRVIRTEKDGEITYAVFDSSGNPAYAVRTVPMLDRIAPVITLSGGESITIPVGTMFTDPGFTAQDNRDGDVTEQVTVEAEEILWYCPGTYTITYTVTDSSENTAQTVRTVTVEPVEHPAVVYPQGKVIYLTFDDGPCPDTVRLLDILKKYDVKATFFVVNTGYPEIMRRIVEEGHSIAIHSMTHDYHTIYASPEAYFADLTGMQQVIFDATGVRTWLMRFPGGGSNTISRFNPGIMTLLTKAVEDAGYHYFDWNVDSDDAGGAVKASTVLRNVIDGVSAARVSVVLQHDIHPYSVDAVEDIILWGMNHGYSFQPLQMDSPGMQHGAFN